jgi:hypothetical protein
MCDAIACLLGVCVFTLSPVIAMNHVATLKANDHELCHCTGDVTQHHEPCCNTEWLTAVPYHQAALTMDSATALMSSCNAEDLTSLGGSTRAVGSVRCASSLSISKHHIATNADWATKVRCASSFSISQHHIATNADWATKVRCASSDRSVHSRIPLVPMPARLKLLHACDHWHSSRMFTPYTGRHCKFRPNTEGAWAACLSTHPSRSARLACANPCGALSARCAFSDSNLHSRMPLDPNACSFQALARVLSNDIPLGSSLSYQLTL